MFGWMTVFANSADIRLSLRYIDGSWRMLKNVQRGGTARLTLDKWVKFREFRKGVGRFVGLRNKNFAGFFSGRMHCCRVPSSHVCSLSTFSYKPVTGIWSVFVILLLGQQVAELNLDKIWRPGRGTWPPYFIQIQLTTWLSATDQRQDQPLLHAAVTIDAPYSHIYYPAGAG